MKIAALIIQGLENPVNKNLYEPEEIGAFIKNITNASNRRAATAAILLLLINFWRARYTWSIEQIKYA